MEKREELIAELHAAYEALGRSPTASEMREMGDYTDRVYEREFGSWNGALKAAKLPVNKPGNACAWVSKSAFLDDVRHVADKVDKAPSLTDYYKHGMYSERIFRKWWDEWADVLIESGTLPAAQE